MNKKINQKGFGVIEVVFIIAVLLLIVGGGLYVLTQNNDIDENEDKDAAQITDQETSREASQFKHFSIVFPQGAEPTSDSLNNPRGESVDVPRDYGFIRVYASTTTLEYDSVERSGVINQENINIDGVDFELYTQSIATSGFSSSRPLIARIVSTNDVKLPGTDEFFSINVDMFGERAPTDEEISAFEAEARDIINSIEFN